MKKMLLVMAVSFFTLEAIAQAVVAGISPVAIQGNYDHGLQGGEGGWPGQVDDGTSSLALDFNINGTNVQGELVMVNDSTPGTNATYGNLLGEEGCATSNPGAYACRDESAGTDAPVRHASACMRVGNFPVRGSFRGFRRVCVEE